jgi:multiple sugar transport system permease protein
MPQLAESNRPGLGPRSTKGKPGWLRRLSTREGFVAVWFLLPALAMLLILRLWPLASAAVTSTQASGFVRRGFVGLENYQRLLQDPSFLNALKVTLLFTVLVNPFQIILALLFAVLLVQRIPAVGVWRSIIFLPAAVPQSVSAVIWGIVFRPDGPFNGALHGLGIGPQPFLTSPSQALASIIIIVSWVGVGFWMMFLIAGLKDIPPDLYEAADVDGAGAMRKFFSVTLPQLRRPLLFVLVADTVSNFLVFAPAQILTKGGPRGSTDLVMVEIFNKAFTTGDVAGASAGTLLLVLVVLVVVAVQFRLLPGRDQR